MNFFFMTSSREFASFNIKRRTTQVFKADGWLKNASECVKIAILTDDIKYTKYYPQ